MYAAARTYSRMVYFTASACVLVCVYDFFYDIDTVSVDIQNRIEQFYAMGFVSMVKWKINLCAEVGVQFVC